MSRPSPSIPGTPTRTITWWPSTIGRQARPRLGVSRAGRSAGAGRQSELNLRYLVLEPWAGRPRASSGKSLRPARRTIWASSVSPWPSRAGSHRPPLYENGYVLFSRSTREAVLIDPGVEDTRIEEFVRDQASRSRPFWTPRTRRPCRRGSLLLRLFSARSPSGRRRRGVGACAGRRPFRRPGPELRRVRGDGPDIPGHTPGSVCFWRRGPLLGGHVFKGGIGSVAAEPLKNQALQSGMVRGIRDRLLVLPDATRVCRPRTNLDDRRRAGEQRVPEAIARPRPRN